MDFFPLSIIVLFSFMYVFHIVEIQASYCSIVLAYVKFTVCLFVHERLYICSLYMNTELYLFTLWRVVP